MLKKNGKKRRKSHEITSLIDVVFILLIFFMVIIAPGSGGGEDDSKRIDLPRVMGNKPDEKLSTLAFRIERDPSVESDSKPNVIYALLPYRLDSLERNRNISYGEAYAQAKRYEGYSSIINSGSNEQAFSGDDEKTRKFILDTINDYLEENHDNLTGVLISAIQETPFGLIEIISDVCDANDIINLEFRTVYP